MEYEGLQQVKLEAMVEDLTEKVKILEKENLEMKLTLEENGISDIKISLSETEYICLNQLRRFKDMSEKTLLTKDDVAMIDILHKNLLISRNIPQIKKSKEKRKTVDELLKIVEGKK